MLFEELVEIAATTLKVSKEAAQKYSRKLDEENAYYFWKPERGGLSMIIDIDTGEKLVAGSLIDFKKLLAYYKEGKRN